MIATVTLSTIVTSQVPVEHWHDVIGDPTLGDAILDRLVHNAHRHNFRRILAWLREFLCLFLVQLWRTFVNPAPLKSAS